MAVGPVNRLPRGDALLPLGFPGEQQIEMRWPRRRDAPVFAEGGMVAAAHPLVTQAGVAILERGGNAVDAAVAAGLVAAVVMPEMCGLGGDLFAIVHAPGLNGGQSLAIHGSGIAPRGASIDLMRARGDAGGRVMPHRGPLSVGVPGMVDAYFALLERFGTRPFALLAERAIAYANDGFPLTVGGARAIAESRDLLTRFPSSAAVFLPGGPMPFAGAVLRQPELAWTLRQLAAGGRDAFYRGEIARRIAAFMAANGGALAVDDLADHETVIAAPLRTTYRGYTVLQTGLPTQGLLLLEMLNIAEYVDLAAIGPFTAAGIHLLAEAKKLAYADRVRYAGDSAFVPIPLDRLLSKEWAAERYARIDPERAAEMVPAGEYRDGDTTFLAVADRSGMMVSLIQSVASNFGSGLVVEETGIVLNNRVGHGFSLEPGHPNVYAPGKKPMHTLNCYLIADADGLPVLVGGTPGGDAQPPWNLQVITALIDGGLDVQAAIDAPRWRNWPGADPSTIADAFELQVEDRIGDDVVAGLEARGHRVRCLGPWQGGGAAQVIARDPRTGVLVSGTDPRVEGLAAGR
ncbi:MAG: gamma-glutamyltransferase [Thermomicrobiales bacterium]